MITVNQLSYKYPHSHKHTIDNLSLSILPGRTYGLLGANGIGKSTLMYLIAGLLKPTAGTVDFNGTSVIKRIPSILSDTFIVPEEIDLPHISIENYVKHNAPFYPRFSDEKFREYLTEFRLTRDMHLGRVSMGQKKKAIIAFALACNTSLLLLDEPTNGLDIPGKSEFRRALINSTSADRIVIVSTHQVRDLDYILDAVIMLNENGLVLNALLSSIQQKFRFNFTPDRAEADKALWSQRTAGGYDTITVRNEDESETDVNLESLFEFAYSNPKIFIDFK